MKDNKLIHCLASVGGPGPLSYPCVADPADRWNGWGKPHFSEKVLLQVLEDTGCKVLCRSSKTITFEVEGSNDEETADLGEHGWEIYGWCWDLTDMDGNRI